MKQTRKILWITTAAGFLCLAGLALLKPLGVWDRKYPYRTGPGLTWQAVLGGLPDMEMTEFSWSYLRLDRRWEDRKIPASPEKTGESAPALRVTNPDFELRLSADYPPDILRVEARNPSGELVFEQETGEIGETGGRVPLVYEDGLYQYTVVLSWTDETRPYRGSRTCRFSLDMDMPAVFTFSSLDVTQGEMIRVTVSHAGAEEIPVLEQFLHDGFTFFRTGATCAGYIPTNFNTRPGQYTISYGFGDGGTPPEKVLEVTVRARDFSIQYMEIDEDIDEATRNASAYAEYNLYFNPVRQTSHGERYYDDTKPFLIPVAGELTTEFGEIRYVNGVLAPDRHSGLDIGAAAGTPVQAVNRGRIVLSRYLILTGNTVVIDHGQGLFSVYFHMQDLYAAQGEMTERGSVIGTVGATGFSTGPHLHFTMSWYHTNIEPGYLLVGEPLTLRNYPK